MNFRAQVLELFAASPDGLTNQMAREKFGVDVRRMGAELCQLLRRGRIVKVSTARYGSVYKLVPTAAPAPLQPTAGSKGTPAPRCIEPASDRPVITPDGVKVQYGPNFSHFEHLQCAPGEIPFGAGFAEVGVGRDVNTGGAWGSGGSR